MVTLDTSALLLFMYPDVFGPIDPTTGKRITHSQKRVEAEIKRISEAGERILIPTPVLSEVLVRAGRNRQQYADEFLASQAFTIAPFDLKAAIELAFLVDADLSSGKKLSGNDSKAKVKFDRQIIAIMKTSGATWLYTDDQNLAKLASNNGISTTMTWDLPIPPEDKQTTLPFPEDDKTDPNKTDGT